jgi:hypothetical protein
MARCGRTRRTSVAPCHVAPRRTWHVAPIENAEMSHLRRTLARFSSHLEVRPATPSHLCRTLSHPASHLDVRPYLARVRLFLARARLFLARVRPYLQTHPAHQPPAQPSAAQRHASQVVRLPTHPLASQPTPPSARRPSRPAIAPKASRLEPPLHILRPPSRTHASHLPPPATRHSQALIRLT